MIISKLFNILVLFLISCLLNIGVYNFIKGKEEVYIEEEVYDYQGNKKEIEIEKGIGYLKIDKIGVYLPILKGTTNETLDKNVVGMHGNSVELDEVGKIILAGHNNKNVFKNLKILKVGDRLHIISKNICYEFKVSEIKVYDRYDYSYYKSDDSKKSLILITCCNDINYRLIIFCELI